eukprot:TRINITY_DN39981_c0_g1_i3.p1 TRINITY_DN39981_c0_g1~~TRINITY_DN39981_c0_g1_i3.p1  ORF type:complete len:486 (-),score=119.69 TRINITY_DN39981_c0_g1_i3:102-1559(-)
MESEKAEEPVPIVLKLNFRTKNKLRVIFWKKSESQFFHESTPLLALVDPKEDGDGTKYIGFANELCGKIVTCSVLPGQDVGEGDTIGTAVPCQHDRLWRTRCENCDKDFSMQLRDGTVHYRHSVNPSILIRADISSMEEEKIASRLLKAKKLHLVFDLDHTLLHGRSLPDDIEVREKIVESIEEHNSIIRGKTSSDASVEQQIHVFSTGNHHFMIRLRPHLFELLRRMEDKFVFYVFTMALRPYATKILRIIDPDHRLFGSRIITRLDDVMDLEQQKSKEKHPPKLLTRLFPTDHRMALVIDDSPEVWGFSNHVLSVPKYLGFNDIGQFEIGGISVESTLKKVGGILSEVHTRFYEQHESSSPNCAKILTELQYPPRGDFLEECAISFTGIVPRTFPISSSRTWKVAQSCGATCLEEITDETTHLVCCFDRPETLKMHENLHTWGLFIVDQSWVHESARNGNREWELFHSRRFPRIWIKVSLLTM